jgi:hypothetical protein
MKKTPGLKEISETPPVVRPCETPVLLLAFSRPETTSRVFEAVRRARATRLFVAVNAPRPGRTEEAERCEAVRKIVQAVDWDCSLHTLFRKEHLGVASSISSAISWFFETVDAGIILEDDCLPDATFFPFCGEMLERYRTTTHVMQVAGYNLLSGKYDSGADYHFSHFGWQWGWATWKRAWQCFDLQMTSWPKFKELGYHQYYPCYPRRISIFDEASAGKIATWDYQWHYAMLSHSGVSVVPRFSLIENIGFDSNATHVTSQAAGDRYRVPVRPMPIPPTHCPFVYADPRYDRLLIREAHSQSVGARIRSAASQLLHRLHLG